MRHKENTQTVLELAKEVGFDLAGITKADVIPEAEEHYKDWIKKGYQADMSYLENTKRRTNPREVLDTAQHVIMLGVNYYSNTLPEKPKFRVARYARGRDYHKYIETLLKSYIHKLNIVFQNHYFRYYVDYGPFLERSYAQKAGLGFIGKSGNLITKDFGSYVFLAEVITSMEELETTEPKVKDDCGDCTLCIDFCPPKAIVAEQTVDAKKCISYQTIENKSDTIDLSVAKNMRGWIFGCDTCQEVCPYNKREHLQETKHKDLLPRYTHLPPNSPTLDSEENFKQKFQSTPLMRAKYSGIRRNISNLIA